MACNVDLPTRTGTNSDPPCCRQSKQTIWGRKKESFFLPFFSITVFFNGEAQEELSNGEKRELEKKEV